jgi:mycofactocin system transcriptional regulator
MPKKAEVAATSARLGRQPTTSRAELSRIALSLFIEHGFEQTTVDDIAAAAGVGRRTVFHYFASKNDLPWGDFDAGLEEMRRFLRELPNKMSVVEAISVAVIEFNRFPAEDISHHRERMKLLLEVPALQAHSALRYAAWRTVLSDFAAERLNLDEASLEPQSIARVFLGISLSAYEQWLRDEDTDLVTVLEEAHAILPRLFSHPSAILTRAPRLDNGKVLP